MTKATWPAVTAERYAGRNQQPELINGLRCQAQWQPLQAAPAESWGPSKHYRMDSLGILPILKILAWDFNTNA